MAKSVLAYCQKRCRVLMGPIGDLDVVKWRVGQHILELCLIAQGISILSRKKPS